MNDLHERFRALRAVRAPDLWPDIEGRTPARGRPAVVARWLAAAAALALAAGGLALAIRAFRGDAPDTRAASAPPQPVVVGTTAIPGAYAVVSGEGSVWVGATASDGGCEGTIHRIDPATGQTIATIPVEGIASWEVGGGGFVVEPGAVWVAGDVCGPGGGGAILQRIDPAANEADVVADLGAGFAADVDATPEAVWVTVFRDRSEAELLRVDPETGAIEATIPTGSQYTREVLEAHGAVWIHPRIVEASTVGSGYLVKIDPRGNEIAGRLDVNMEAPAAWNGSLWAHHGDTIIRIDPARVTVEERYEEAGSSAYGFLRSGAGGLWFIHTRDAPGVGAAPVVRFNPATGSIDVVADLGPDLIPIDVAVTESAVWVVNYDGSLTHVELRSP